MEVGFECVRSHESRVIDVAVACFVTSLGVGLLRLQADFKVTRGASAHYQENGKWLCHSHKIKF